MTLCDLNCKYFRPCHLPFDFMMFSLCKVLCGQFYSLVVLGGLSHSKIIKIICFPLKNSI